MAMRIGMLSSSGESPFAFALSLRKWIHAMAQPAPFYCSISHNVASQPPPPLVLPEFENNESSNNNNVGFHFPNLPFGSGSMELMAVPKKKTSPHKKGIRNGPKALKAVPVIIRCRVCGRVKLPHFFCCGGIRDNPGEHSSNQQNDS